MEQIKTIIGFTIIFIAIIVKIKQSQYLIKQHKYRLKKYKQRRKKTA